METTPTSVGSVRSNVKIGATSISGAEYVQGGWRPKKRKLSALTSESGNVIDFIFENPMHGLFKDMNFTKKLISENTFVKLKSTSYCKYGTPYQKNTVFVGTLALFEPWSPCSVTKCNFARIRGRHKCGVKDLTPQQKNSIPNALVELEISAWKRAHADSNWRFIFLDVFTGYGSVASYVKQAHPDVHVLTNDIVKRPNNSIEADMTKFSLDLLLKMAILNFCGGKVPSFDAGVFAWLWKHKVAVLFHLSTPCQTYSVDGKGYHRHNRTTEPKTDTALKHDTMNKGMMEWLSQAVCDSSRMRQ